MFGGILDIYLKVALRKKLIHNDSMRLVKCLFGLSLLAVGSSLFYSCSLIELFNKNNSSNTNKSSVLEIEKKSGFVYTDGSKFFDYDGNEFKIKGMNFSNNVYASDNFKYSWAKDHNEESYKELSELGFNTIRYYLNYRMFESDDNPGVYSEEAFGYMDQEIECAKKYGMRILFNMHYPQGGYQSSGSGHALWQGENAASNQERLTNLWGEFARRYVNETGVLGYGLVNEPYLLGSDYDSAMAGWTSLSQKIRDKIRSYDNHHIIFVERAYQIKNPATNIQISYTATQGYPSISDYNYAYEIHFYEPGVFTNQGIPWSSHKNDSYTWPNEEDVIAVYNRKSMADDVAISKKYSGSLSTGTEWQELQTPELMLSQEKDSVANFRLKCSYLGSETAEGVLYLDYLEMIEKNNGVERVVYKADFTESTEGFDKTGCSILQKSTEELAALGIEDCDGALEIKGTTGYAHIINQINQVPVKDLRRYSLKIRFIVNVAENAENTNLTLELIPCTAVVRYHDKDFLVANLKPYAEYAESNGVPLYVGEFGLYKFAFFEIDHEAEELTAADKGAGQYIRDLISVFDQYDLSYSYHCYHEDGFGLYCDAWKSVPSESPAKERRIDELYQAFVDSVK